MARRDSPTGTGPKRVDCKGSAFAGGPGGKAPRCLPNAGRRATVRPMASPDPASPLPADRLYRAADIAALSFDTTAELATTRVLVDQPRAYQAIRFGTKMAVRGFNIFAIGANGARIHASVRALLEEAARGRPKPPDWVYVNNFATPHRPMAISLPREPRAGLAEGDAGADRRFEGCRCRRCSRARTTRSAAAPSNRASAARNERALNALRDKATAKGIAILRTPMGFAMAPMKDGQVVPPADFNAWPAEQQQAVTRPRSRNSRRTWRRRCAPCRGSSASSAMRCANWISETARVHHRPADRGVQGEVRRPAEGAGAHRRDPGGHPRQRRAVHQSAGHRRGRKPGRRCASAACSTATGSMSSSPRTMVNPARR